MNIYKFVIHQRIRQPQVHNYFLFSVSLPLSFSPSSSFRLFMNLFMNPTTATTAGGREGGRAHVCISGAIASSASSHWRKTVFVFSHNGVQHNCGFGRRECTSAVFHSHRVLILLFLFLSRSNEHWTFFGEGDKGFLLVHRALSTTDCLIASIIRNIVSLRPQCTAVSRAETLFAKSHRNYPVSIAVNLNFAIIFTLLFTAVLCEIRNIVK